MPNVTISDNNMRFIICYDFDAKVNFFLKDDSAGRVYRESAKKMHLSI